MNGLGGSLFLLLVVIYPLLLWSAIVLVVVGCVK
jgi:hypothetical protein